MEFFEDDFSYPSGVVLPPILKRKLDSRNGGVGPTNSVASNDNLSGVKRRRVEGKTGSATGLNADEMEAYFMRASSVMVEVQKQLYRGEEVYHEDTNAHGNVFRGWDAFVDLKDVGVGAGSSSMHLVSGSGTRRMPSDQRWFSGSCRSVMKNSRPASFFVPMSRSASTTPIPRSEVPTPVSRVTSPTPRMEVHEVMKPPAAKDGTGSAPVPVPKKANTPQLSSIGSAPARPASVTTKVEAESPKPKPSASQIQPVDNVKK